MIGLYGKRARRALPSRLALDWRWSAIGELRDDIGNPLGQRSQRRQAARKRLATVSLGVCSRRAKKWSKRPTARRRRTGRRRKNCTDEHTVAGAQRLKSCDWRGDDVNDRVENADRHPRYPGKSCANRRDEKSPGGHAGVARAVGRIRPLPTACARMYWRLHRDAGLARSLWLILTSMPAGGGARLCPKLVFYDIDVIFVCEK